MAKIDSNNECLMLYEKNFKLGLCKRQYKKSDRLFIPRMSLLGKPIHYARGSHRHDARYRLWQGRFYNFLERPRGLSAVFYHVMVFFLVFACLFLSIFATIAEYQDDASFTLYHMEVLVVVWLTVEFFIRLWSAGVRSRYQGFVGRLKFMTGTFCIVDIITISASIIALCKGAPHRVFGTSTLRGLRFFQILRMLRMDRRGGSWKLLGSVVYAHRQEMLTTVYIGFLSLTFAAFVVYLVERDVNEQFNNFAKALWWGVITLCTIGYGDAVPVTWQGKLIGSLVTLLSYSFFALPAGILGSGFALKVQQQQRQKHMISRYQPAAILIQSAWRFYASDENSTAVATWTIHKTPLRPAPNSPRYNRPFTRLPSLRRRSQTINSPADIANVESAKSARYLSVQDRGAESPDEDYQPEHTHLTKKHKIAIRFIRMLKLLVARRKFKEALKPYDVKDVLEQYAAGHADLLGRVKNIHARLDYILGGKRAPKIKDAGKICLATRVVKIERQISDMEDKLDLFIRQYMEDRKYNAQMMKHDLNAKPMNVAPNDYTTDPPNRNDSSAIPTGDTSSKVVPRQPTTFRSQQQNEPTISLQRPESTSNQV